MQKSTIITFVAIAIVLIASLAVKTKASRTKSLNAKKKKPLSENEQPMYFKLVETFPELVVLAQVSFSALMTSRNQSDRNKFNRKMADFVLCTKAFEVVTVVELDDSSHKGRNKEDAERDEMLKAAGHRVIRFKRTPNNDELLKAVFPPVPVVKDKK